MPGGGPVALDPGGEIPDQIFRVRLAEDHLSIDAALGDVAVPLADNDPRRSSRQQHVVHAECAEFADPHAGGQHQAHHQAVAPVMGNRGHQILLFVDGERVDPAAARCFRHPLGGEPPVFEPGGAGAEVGQPLEVVAVAAEGVPAHPDLVAHVGHEVEDRFIA